MFSSLSDYLKQNSREERRAHLDLNQSCIEIGTDSRTCRGLLGHYFKTRVDYRNGYVCHACNNSKCSNVNHLYWGSPTDNHIDQVEAGTHKSIYQRTKEKYGEEKLRQIYQEAGRLGGKAKRKSVLGEDVISKRIKDFNNEPNNRGKISRLSKKWNVSHTQVTRFLKSRELI